jgi:hypothetical protein
MMSTWAVLAAKEAAVATGLGAGLVPAIGAGSVDGFVVGALMSGAAFIMIGGPARARRRASLADGAAMLQAANRTGYMLAAGSFSTGRDDALAAAERLPDQEAMLEPGEEYFMPEPTEDSGYRSRHRVGDGSLPPPRPESRHGVPRHAAPPASFGSRMSALFAGRAQLSTARD